MTVLCDSYNCIKIGEKVYQTSDILGTQPMPYIVKSIPRATQLKKNISDNRIYGSISPNKSRGIDIQTPIVIEKTRSAIFDSERLRSKTKSSLSYTQNDFSKEKISVLDDLKDGFDFSVKIIPAIVSSSKIQSTGNLGSRYESSLGKYQEVSEKFKPDNKKFMIQTDRLNRTHQELKNFEKPKTTQNKTYKSKPLICKRAFIKAVMLLANQSLTLIIFSLKILIFVFE